MPQPQPQPTSQGFPVPVSTNLDASVANTTLRLDDILNRFEKLLNGYQYEGYNRWILPKDARPYMTQEGIRYTMLILSLLHSRITTLGNKRDLQAYDELFTVMAHYSIWLRTNAKTISFDTKYIHSFLATILCSLSSTFTHDSAGLLLGLPPQGMNNGQQQQAGVQSLFRM